MQYIAHFDPSIGSSNLGDQIISLSVKQALSSTLDNIHLISFPTQLKLNRTAVRTIAKTDMAIVGGSNLLCPSLLNYRQWKIGLLEALTLKNTMLFGVGWHSYGKEADKFSQFIYRKLLNNGNYHSVRDEYTKKQLERIGIPNVINTGCPTLWTLTEEHCREINTEKQLNVVFTLSDWRKNPENDLKLLMLLKKHYDQVYFWPQGKGDLEYLHNLESDIANVVILGASVAAFDKQMQTRDCDYIGTRLHGGIRALHHKCRSLILGVDNRAIEMQRDFNIPVVAPEDESAIEQWILSPQTVKINLNWQNIQLWKQQLQN